MISMARLRVLPEWAVANTLAGAIFVFLSTRPGLWVSTGLALLADHYGALTGECDQLGLPFGEYPFCE